MIKWPQYCVLFLITILWGGGLLKAQRINFEMLQEVVPIHDFQANSESFAITQNKGHYLFFAHEKGALMFDGMYWRNFNPNDSRQINTVASSLSTDHVFYGAVGDIGRMDFDQKGEMHFHSFLNELPDSVKHFRQVLDAYVVGNNVYFNLKHRVLMREIDRSSWSEIQLGPYIRHIFPLKAGIFIESPNKWVLYRYGRKLPIPIRNVEDHKVEGVIEISPSHLILVGRYGQNDWVMDLNPKTGEHSYWDLPKKLGRIEGSAKIRNGLIGIYTRNRGVIYLSIKSQSVVRRIERKEGMSSNRVYDLFVDFRGISWIITSKSIVQVRNDGVNFKHFQEGDQYKGMVTKIFRQSDDTLYFGTEQEFGRIIENSDQDMPRIEILSDDSGKINDIQESKELGIVISTEEGLFRWSVRRQQIERIPSVPNRLRDFLIFQFAGNEWLCLARSNYVVVYQLKGGKAIKRWKETQWEGVPNQLTVGTLFPDGSYRIWVNHANGELAELKLHWGVNEGLAVSKRYFGATEGFDPGLGFEQSLAPVLGENVFQSEDSFWHFMEEEDRFEQVNPPLKGVNFVLPVSPSEKKLLISERSAEEDYFWIGQWTGKEMVPVSRSIYGLNLGTIRTGAGGSDHGRVWVGGRIGLLSVNTELFNIPFGEFRPRVLRLDYLNGDYTRYMSPTFSETVTIPYDSLPVRVNYSVIGENMMPHKYRYRITAPKRFFSGESHWSEWSYDHKIVLEHLYEGAYRVDLQSQNTFGHSSETTQFNIVILPPFYRKWYMLLLYFFGLIGLMIISGKWFSYKLRREKKVLEHKVKERTRSIARKNELLEEKNQAIREQAQVLSLKNEQISRDMRYGAQLQRMNRPREEELQQYFADHFVFSAPKDTIGGDFYMIIPLDEGRCCMVVGDCTGHGVPGALVSSIATVLIRETVNFYGLEEPCEILERLDHEFGKLMKNENPYLQEGMELGLAQIDRKRKKIKYAGARRSLWVLQSGQVLKVKGVRRSIGEQYLRGASPYTQQEFDYKGTEGFFLFTDGLTDQFGGEGNRKFGFKQLEQLIQKQQSQQGVVLSQKLFVDAFYQWKRAEEQVDDVTIVGFTL
ncbi:SpoIIE family protein phosphatase [Persicobacter psychrovividus]